MIDSQDGRKGQPQRAERINADRRERRRSSDDTGEGYDLKLPIPDWVYDKFPRTHFAHRWIRDEPGRIAGKFKQDWDPVEGVEPVPGAVDKFGNPISHVLHVKHLDWYNQDRASLEETRREIVKQMERGSVAGKGDDAGQTLRSEVSYADRGNRLG